MGCDIHLYAEYKVDNSEWIADKHHNQDCDHSYSIFPPIPQCFSGDRNYGLFAAIASVRGESNLKPLGLPDDLSETLKPLADDYNNHHYYYHSYSYMTLDKFELISVQHGGYFGVHHYISETAEFIQHCKEYMKQLEFDFVAEQYLLGKKKKTKKTKIKCRVIFGFDS